jgi:hypothetical protein
VRTGWAPDLAPAEAEVAFHVLATIQAGKFETCFHKGGLFLYLLMQDFVSKHLKGPEKKWKFSSDRSLRRAVPDKESITFW